MQEALLAYYPDFHMIAVFCMIAAAIVLYATDKLPIELTSVTILAALLVFFHLFPYSHPETGVALSAQMLLRGFANPALMAIIALLVLGHAVVRTGALNTLAAGLLAVSFNNKYAAVFLSLVTVTVISAFLNNTPVVVIFIPLLSLLARRLGFSVSMVMIPLSFAAILGGMTTLIGSSTNLLVAGELESLDLGHLDFFDFAVPGTLLAIIGMLYILFIAPWLLPDRASIASELVGGENRQFITQIEIEPSSGIVDKPVDSQTLFGTEHIKISMIQRGERAFLPPFDQDMRLEAGDVMIVSATRKVLTDLLSNTPDLFLHQFPEISDLRGGGNDKDKSKPKKQDVALSEIVIAPASRMIGQTLQQVGFRYNHHCIVLGMQRRSRVIRTRMTDVRLAAGDVLLVLGAQEDILTLQETNDILVTEWSQEALPARRYGLRTALIFFGVVGIAALDLAPIHITALTGAAVALLTGCLNIRQAARAIDGQIILLIGASLAMGTALEMTGGAAYLAGSLVDATEGASPTVIMSLLFLLMAFMTNILSNNAAAVLFTPIAANMAHQLGADPMMFIFAVIFACNCSFATPIGYQTNLLVMGPGHYKFSDFMRAGIPLMLLIWAAYTAYAHWYFGYGLTMLDTWPVFGWIRGLS